MLTTQRFLMFFLFLLTTLVSGIPVKDNLLPVANEQELIDYLTNEYEKEASEVGYKQVVAEWNAATDIDNKTKVEALENQTLITAKYTKDIWAKHFKGLNSENVRDPILKREILFLSVLGTPALDDEKISKLSSLGSKMENIYATGKICPYNEQKCNLTEKGLSLEPGIEGVLSTSTDYDELAYVWKAWRDATGKKMKKDYKERVELSNEAAHLNGFKDMGEMWRHRYESKSFVEDMDRLWKDVKPLYDELHTYVLGKLRERYPRIASDSDGLMPAHLTGNMWAQSWIYLYDLVKPFENTSAADSTEELKAQGYTALKMFETADEFYKSLGLEPNDVCYNVSAGAVIEKPKDREIICHASAWDFSNGKDYRVKMCTEVNQEDFITIHHEMGHIEYFILYKNQPVSLRSGANPGFHEAVGDTIALSVANPGHLKKIGLLKDYEDTEEASINALMLMALERVAFLPFGLLIDKWRWDVFSGNATENEWNARWWQYRKEIQKVKPPVERTENDFDPGAKYHVPADSEYIAYFVAHILEFQLYRSLCITAGKYDPNNPESEPLHKCDFYQSKEAGAKLRAGLSLGASKHWSEALEAMTGEKDLSGSAILEYFKPLYDYLKDYNQNGKSSLKPASRIADVVQEGQSDSYVLPIILGSIVIAIVVIVIAAAIVVWRRKSN